MKNSIRFIPMYGTRSYQICEEGIIFSARDMRTLNEFKSYRSPNLFNRQITLQDTFPVRNTLAEFIMYSFHGYTPSKIELKWDFEDIVESNLVYKFDKIVIGDNGYLYLDDEEFRPVVYDDDRIKDEKLLHYINRYGCIVVKRGNSVTSLRWRHAPNGYPNWLTRCTTYQVHRLVYSTFVGKIQKGYTINHDDHNLWNAYVGNLRPLTRSENSIEGCANNGRTKLSESIARYIAQAIANNISINEIAGYVERETGYDRKTALNLIYRIKGRKTYNHVTSDIDMSNYEIRPKGATDMDAIRKACQLLQDHPEYYDKTISDMSGVSPTSVRFLRSGDEGQLREEVMAIRNEFNINPVNMSDKGRFVPKLTPQQVRDIYRELHTNTSISNVEMGRRYDVSPEVIRGIRNRQTNVAYSKALEGFMEEE